MILCESLDDLYSTILSSDIISIDEKALIPPHMDEGNVSSQTVSYDMYSFRFLFEV